MLGRPCGRGQIARNIAARLDSFDEDLEARLTELLEALLRFNRLFRIFFELVVQVDRPGSGWKQEIKKGELPVYNPRVVSFALTPHFAAIVDQSQVELPDAHKRA